jgi:enoyl-CoA hydratase/carnithine racemase
MNAVIPLSFVDLCDALDDLSNDEEVRVVILTGAGRTFCAGGDFSKENTQAQAPRRASLEAIRTDLKAGPQRAIRKLHTLPKPTIAMVNGAAVGLGFDLALACDMRVGSEKARFRVAFTRMAAVPGDGGAWLLPRIIGLPKAIQLTFTGDTVEAEEAYKLGVLNELVKHEELEEKTMALANKVAQGPALAIRLDKMLLYRSAGADLDTAMELAAFAQGICLTSEDHKEAVSAFQEKREPVFKGK